MKRAGPLVLVALAACAQTPSHVRPWAEVPASYRMPSGPAVGGEPGAVVVPDAPWWGLFRDPALLDLVARALAGNHDLAAAAARVEQARGALGVARSDLAPHVELSAGIDARRDPDLFGFASERTVHQALASIPAYEVDLFGRVRAATAAACADLLATEEARRTVEIALVAEVATSWFTLRELDEELSITRAAVATRDEAVNLIERRAQAGTASGFERAQAEAERATTASTVPEIERQVAAEEHRLSFLIGGVPRAIARGDPRDAPLPPDVPAGIPSALLERRPDVREAERRLEAAEARVAAARAAFFPTISLTALLGFQSDSLASLFTAPSRTWSFAPRIAEPIFDAGRRRGDLHAAQAREAETIALYRRAVEAAFRETADALFAWRKAGETQVEVERYVDASRRAVDLARKRYEGGMASYLEVLDPQRQALRAELDLARARLARRRALITLYQALGGGW
jgi:multidrug efflux system outer membrane protein